MNSTNAIVSKEAVAARMFRHAARYWGYNDADIDNFDPLVRLLIEACSVELYRISNEISSVQERMLDKLARLLTPEVYTAPTPAHAILHARAVEPELSVYPAMQFFFQRKVPSKPGGPNDANLDIFFSPAGNYRVFNGDVRFMASGNSFYNVNAQQLKESFGVSGGYGRRLPAHTLWLGIELDPQVKSLDGLTFFFDLKNYPTKNALFPLLHYGQWSSEGRALEIEEGLCDALTGAPAFSAFTSFDEFDINQNVERKVNHLYRQQFITVRQPAGALITAAPYPAEFAQVLSQSELGRFQQPLHWIKLVLLPEFDEQVLDDLSVSINCFPIVNRHLNEVRYRLNQSFNIIPLLSPEQFLSVKSVHGTDLATGQGHFYSSNPFEARDTKGTYSVRTGDVERFDSRDAIEYLNYALELLRDESRAFAALGQDFVASLIKELNQNIALLEQKVRQNLSMLNQTPTYLLVNPHVEGENIFAEYWTTNGEMGNGIRSGLRLDLYQGADLAHESMLLMTSTTGGKDKLQNTQVLDAYRNTLITRGRMVTLEDIRSFCQMRLEGRAHSVTVQKGVGVSPLPHAGLVNLIDIEVLPLPGFRYPEEWDTIKADLVSDLELQSAVSMHYQVRVRLED
ncbi:type VI secretion system baseplate subunit TssF [Flaviaesturariibacter amylovorans]|uniref:Type VI secretion system baseplate subunit TssF n=1 Tax=Flaviaesturariibacter amylovorans TaxID=1084520 RepID=A0ABP8HRD6_9BACT